MVPRRRPMAHRATCANRVRSGGTSSPRRFVDSETDGR
uniref:Uncharacterized protein n=1 Tax=Human herpesvirus 2 TaxID=10310 RepID=A0A481TVH0_HHV2|nr:hypothetical protein [Human alphaherpesvirus 2]QBH78389.1 hypothetical protein [Human alphaherpesvirus 2]QBH82795.1 hypothetical protein [Human alphaherpesvirus 2]QBH85300.1 hypothetical protein [Human alphaherpesvirus 2]